MGARVWHPTSRRATCSGEPRRESSSPQRRLHHGIRRRSLRVPASTSSDPKYWLVKSEPFKYAWDRLVADGRACWDGVRNAEARIHLRAMKRGDLALFYHSNEGKQVVGVARCVRESYPDPTSDDPQWLAVDVEPVMALAKPVDLTTIKRDSGLAGIALVTRSRLSVMPIAAPHFARILALGETSLSKPKPKPKAAPRQRAKR
jgi:predicted RNA-binding protein with PUA-like domain